MKGFCVLYGNKGDKRTAGSTPPRNLPLTEAPWWRSMSTLRKTIKSGRLRAKWIQIFFYQHEIQCKIRTFLCRNRTDKKTDRISNAISIKLDKLRLTVTVSAKVKSDYFFVLEKGSAMEEKWIIKDANDNRAYNSDKYCWQTRFTCNYRIQLLLVNWRKTFRKMIDKLLIVTALSCKPSRVLLFKPCCSESATCRPCVPLGSDNLAKVMMEEHQAETYHFYF